MTQPRISITSQLSAVERAAGRLNCTSNAALTPGQAQLEARDLDAAASSLQWLSDNREWIAAEAARQRRPLA
jgi:hypothetical protein